MRGNPREMGKNAMPMNTVTTAPQVTTSAPRRTIYISGMAIRVIVALIISWLIVMAFFVTTVASH